MHSILGGGHIRGAPQAHPGQGFQARVTLLSEARARRAYVHLRSTAHLKTIGTHAAIIAVMKPFRWPSDKNDLLKAERGISFEEVTVAVEAGALLDVVPHPNPAKYPRQKVMVVEVAGYAYLVPFVEEDDHFFLKTIIPSRKATRDFIAKESDDV
jgi:hypothetical protein